MKRLLLTVLMLVSVSTAFAEEWSDWKSALRLQSTGAILAYFSQRVVATGDNNYTAQIRMHNVSNYIIYFDFTFIDFNKSDQGVRSYEGLVKIPAGQIMECAHYGHLSSGTEVECAWDWTVRQ